MKLRNRLAISFIVTASLLVLIVFFIVYEVVKQTAYSNIDEHLLKETSEIISSLSVFGDSITIINLTEWYEHEHDKVEINPIFIQLKNKDLQTIKKSKNLIDYDLPVFKQRNKQFISNINLEIGELRMIQTPIVNKSGEIIAYLVIALSRTNAEAVLHNLRTVLFITFPISLLILFFISRFFADKSIAPVYKLIKSAEEITKESLNNRIELPENKDELYTLTKTINNLLDRLQEAILHEKQFTTDASHDLRTPLATIKGTLEVLIRKKREPEFYEEKISYCINEIDRMNFIIDQLLILARNESDNVQVNYQKFSLRNLINKIIDRLEPMIYSKKIKFNFIGVSDLDLYLDQNLTEIILENVLSNSIKYSNQNSQVTIEIINTGEEKSCTVIDNGFGITEEQKSKMFDRFYRAESSRNSSIPGAGLGLAIVKKLSDLQNIKLEVRSKVGTGTKFKIIFPDQN